MNRFRVGLVAAFLGGLLTVVVAGASPAAAHADYKSSDPAKGAAVEQLPPAAEVVFTEAVGQPAAVSVTGPSGENVTAGALEVVDDTLTTPLDTAGDAGEGTYTLDYRVTSSDGHPISGTVTFSVGAPGAAPATGTGDVGAAVAGDRVDTGPGSGLVWGLVGGLVLVLGLAVVSLGRLVGRDA